jgi:hypothetical protein
MASQSEPSISRQRQRSAQQRSRRYVPTPVYRLAEHLKQVGVELHKIRGPWHPIRRPLSRLGRNAQMVISVVTNGMAEFAVDTAQRAADLSGLLNSCGVDHLDPVHCVRPPEEGMGQA